MVVTSRKNKAVFLDRDGVLNISLVHNQKPYAPRTLDDFRLYPEAKECLVALKQLGYILIVVTNQPDVGNGYVHKEIVEEMNKVLATTLPVDEIKTCFHSQRDGCNCRKPNTEMLELAAKEYRIDFSNSFLIGDRNSDIEAGRAVGCKNILIDHGYAETVSTNADMIVESLSEATNYIILQTRKV